ncbi:hypothetical protein [Bacillus sp. FJAT-45037]|uniref:hypothetical protein n=1 Tax=Bacillus sp. FJAT-45037 TaxID=2011007 RepID=UPI000C24116A|nr:hypothetical protein [Bacillus sp. FJAT-45037]
MSVGTKVVGALLAGGVTAGAIVFTGRDTIQSVSSNLVNYKDKIVQYDMNEKNLLAKIEESKASANETVAKANGLIQSKNANIANLSANIKHKEKEIRKFKNQIESFNCKQRTTRTY